MSGTPIDLPDEVRSALSGWPQVGIWDQMFAMLTVDAAGFPHVCLLSRAQLDAGAAEVRALVAGQTTSANLRRSGQATLIVIGSTAAWYCKLRVHELRDVDGEPLAAKFHVVSVKRDSAGVELQPARFMPTAAVTTQEDWEHGKRLLASLSEPSP